jgi:hypothetical protein
MSQPNLDPDRHMSRGRKERSPAQLAVLAQAREKAKMVIAVRAKIIALQKTVPSPEPVSEQEPSPPPPPEPVSEYPLEPVSVSENEDGEPRLTRREVGEMIQRTVQRHSPKYHYLNGMYNKIK